MVSYTHLVGLEFMTSPSSLLLQEEYPLELDFMAVVFTEIKKNLFFFFVFFLFFIL